MKNRGRNCGFTMVELAVVLVIIGILIGGILKAEQLISQARISRAMTDVKDIQVAALTFREKYGNWPGDYSAATRRLVGCDAANFCIDGNGNTEVGPAFMDIPQTSDPMPVCNLAVTESCEAVMYWKHLSFAGLLTGTIRQGADPAVPAPGLTHPTTPLGGAFNIFYNAYNRPDFGVGNVLLWANVTSGKANMLEGKNVLTPRIAENLDRKFDNGNSNTGWITADSVRSLCDVDYMGPEPFGSYKISDPRKNCIMFFDFE